MRRRRVIALVAVVASGGLGWWVLAARAPTSGDAPVSRPAPALVPGPLAEAARPASAGRDVESRPRVVAVDAGGESAASCVPALLVEQSAEQSLLEVTIDGAKFGPGQPPYAVRLELVEPDGGQALFEAVAPSGRFFLRTCDAKLLTVSGPGLQGEAASPGLLRGVGFGVDDAPSPGETVTGRTVRNGEPAAGVVVNGHPCIPATSGADGRFSLHCRGPTVGLWVSPPWRVATPSYGRVEPGGTLDVGDLVVRLAPVADGKIGVAWERQPTPVIATVTASSPAERAGLRKGDVLLEVNGRGIATVDETLKLVPGAPDTVVRLKVLRGADVLLIDVTRQGPLSAD